MEGKGFIKNVSNTFLTRVLCLGLSIINGAIVARLLGPSGKGELAVTLMIPSLLSLVLNFGINVANVYYTGSRKINVPTLISNSVAMALMFTAITVPIYAILFRTGWLEQLVPGLNPHLLLIASIIIPIGLLGNYFNSVLLGQQRIPLVNLITLIQAICSLILVILLVGLLRMGVKGAIVGAPLAAMVFLCLTAWMLGLRKLDFLPRWRWSIIRQTLSFGLRGHIGNIFQFFNYRLDIFIVNYFLGVSSVGFYVIAVKLAELVWYVPNAVGFVIFPKASASTAQEMNNFTPKVFRGTLLIIVLGALGLATVGAPMIKLVYSAVFLPSFKPMLVLLPGVVLLGAAKVLTNEIAGRGKPQYNSINAFVSLVLTVIFGLILIPRYGIVGAAAASTISYTVTFILAVWFYQIVTKVRPTYLFRLQWNEFIQAGGIGRAFVRNIVK